MVSHVAQAVASRDRAQCRVPGPLPAVGLAGGTPCEPAAGIDPYLVQRLAGRRDEMLLCLFYDGAGAFRAERSWQGGPSSVAADRRDIMRATAASDARYVILAHNHPSDSARPSARDVDATRHLYRLFAALGVTLVDHAIVACDGLTFSFRMAGLI